MTAKVVVITGASSGIGAALARQLAARGEKIVLAARREAELKQAAVACGPDALAVVTDVTRRADVDHLRDEALRVFGRVDVWVNNAGRGIGRQVLDLTDEDIDAMMAINVKSAVYGMQAIVPHFKTRGAGHLINISSGLSRIPFASYRSVYSAAKAALNSLTATLRLDLRAQYPDIHVSVVMPPMVKTDFAKNALYGTPVPPGGFRPGVGSQGQTPEQVVAAIVDLIDHPRPEIYTDPGQAELAARYYADVAAFEATMGR
jgi:NAD(P)-dependent dehydrogenase (short-subunit alcohol dehydrogenase family)